MPHEGLAATVPVVRLASCFASFAAASQDRADVLNEWLDQGLLAKWLTYVAAVSVEVADVIVDVLVGSASKTVVV